MILKAKHSKVYLCCEAEVSGSGSTRPDTNSAPESTRWLPSWERASHLALCVCCHIFMFRHPEPSFELLCLPLLSLHLSRLVSGLGF